VADDDVFRRAVDLHDPEVHRLADERVKIAHRTDVDLRAGEERVNPQEVHHDAAFDPAHAAALQDFPRLERFRDPFPDTHEIRALPGEDQDAVFVFHGFEKHLDLVADFELVPVLELGERDVPFGLEADVDGHLGVADVDDPPVDDLPLADLPEGSLVHLREIVALGIAVFLVTDRHPSRQPAHHFRRLFRRVCALSHSSSCCVTYRPA
jgi:hypothetical protein